MTFPALPHPRSRHRNDVLTADQVRSGVIDAVVLREVSDHAATLDDLVTSLSLTPDEIRERLNKFLIRSYVRTYDNTLVYCALRRSPRS